jgi:hypothetical protein
MASRAGAGVNEYLIRVEGELSDELLSAFPQLHVEVEPVQTVLSGRVVDSAELTGIVNHLDTVGLQIVEIIRLPA